MQTSQGNDIAERVIAYWEAEGEILPEVNQMTRGQCVELIDSIPNEHGSLIAMLQYTRLGLASDSGRSS